MDPKSSLQSDFTQWIYLIHSVFIGNIIFTLRIFHFQTFLFDATDEAVDGALLLAELTADLLDTRELSRPRHRFKKKKN